MKRLRGVVLVVAGLAVPGGAQAQVAWDSPMLLPPRPPAGFGIFLADVAGGEVGVLGTWRPGNYGLRLGLAEDGSDNLAVLGGIDFSGALASASRDLPVNVDWVFGAGASIGNDVMVSIPLGLSAGFSFGSDGARFTPYITPRVVVDAFFGGAGENLDLALGVDLGLDLRFAALRGAMIRFGATLDRDAVALGLVF